MAKQTKRNKNQQPRESKPLAVLHKYLKQCEDITKGGAGWLFRGHDTVVARPHSKIYRTFQGNGRASEHAAMLQKQQDLLDRLRTEKGDSPHGEKLNNLELLAYIQHHDADTCLLDYTENLCFALLLACEGDEQEGEVLLLDKNSLPAHTKWKQVGEKEIKATLAEVLAGKTCAEMDARPPAFWYWKLPTKAFPRILVQQAWVVFARSQNEEGWAGELRTKRFVVKRGDKKLLREALLAYHGYHRGHFFVDKKAYQGGQVAQTSRAADGVVIEFSVAQERITASQKHEVAKQFFDAVLAINPKDADAYNNRGVTKAELGQHKEALEDYNQALALNPKDANAYNNRGNAKAALGDAKGALEDYNKALALNPKDAKAYNNRGVAKAALGEHKEALEDYNQALALNPKDANAYNNRGVAKAALGQHKGALEDYNKALALNPNYANAYNNRGVAKAELGDAKGALEDYNKALALNPKDAKAYNNRGVAKAELGDAKGALEDYNKAQALASKTPPKP